jgi:hypothetical protein
MKFETSNVGTWMADMAGPACRWLILLHVFISFFTINRVLANPFGRVDDLKIFIFKTIGNVETYFYPDFGL